MVTNKWTFENKACIELPISCSIKSEEKKCGALKLTTDKSVIVEAGPIRMTTIEKSTTREHKVKISEATFRGNTTEEAKPISDISESILGVDNSQDGILARINNEEMENMDLTIGGQRRCFQDLKTNMTIKFFIKKEKYKQKEKDS